MLEDLNIGATPPNEDCAQIGTDGYYEKSHKECVQYIMLLRRALGPEPTGARLKIKSFRHDFGTYKEVVCVYDTDIKESLDYALKCEGEGPMNWDDTARQALGLENQC